MKSAVVVALFAIFAILGVAAGGSLNNKTNRVEDKCEARQVRIEYKIDKLVEAQKELSVAIGRIEEKLNE
jgi:hypothetical protein